jgi:hypothetical protein
MEVDNFIIGKREERIVFLKKKATAACKKIEQVLLAQKNRAVAAWQT